MIFVVLGASIFFGEGKITKINRCGQYLIIMNLMILRRRRPACFTYIVGLMCGIYDLFSEKASFLYGKCAW